MNLSKSSEAVATPLDVGLHYDIPAATYHADPCPTPSLSSGIARKILSRSIEHAWLDHTRLNPNHTPIEPTGGMIFGSAVHAIQSGSESEIALGDYPDFRTNAAKDWKKAILVSGRTPILRHKFDEDVRPTAEAILKRAADGIDNTPFAKHGRSEVTAIWKEGSTYCRARYDRLMIPEAGIGCVDIWDWKTTSDVSPIALKRHIVSMGYHVQAAFYLRGLAALMGKKAGQLSFTFAFVETSAPHHVRRAFLSPDLMRHSERQVQDAIDQWSHAIATNSFRAPTETLEVELPSYLDDLSDEISVS